MGIDLKKIGELQNLAANIDAENGNKNSKLDTEIEITIFEGELAKLVAQGEISADDSTAIKNIFGLEKKDNNSTTTPEGLSRKDMKRNRNAIKDSVERYVKQGVKPEDLMAKLNNEYQNSEYAPFLNDVQKMVNAIINTEYNSKEDIENLKKTVKEDLDIKKRDWQYDVLNDLVKQAEEDQINKEFEALVEMYNGVKATMAGTDIVKEKGDHFKAYASIVKDELQEKGPDGKKLWDKSYTKEAYARLEEYIKAEAKGVVMSQITETTATKKRPWVKEMKAMNTSDDPYQTSARKKADTARTISLRHNKYEKTYEELGSISRDELKKALGKDLFEKFNRSYLINHQNADGTYNLQDFAAAIKMRAGADYNVNKSDDTEASERHNIKAEVAALLGNLPIDEISNKDAKRIIDFVGLDREKNIDLLKGFVKNTIPGVLVGLLTGGLAKGGSQQIRQTVNLAFDSQDIAADTLDALKSQNLPFTTTQLEDGKVLLTIKQEVLRNNRAFNALMGAGIGVLQGALMTLLFGDGKTFEKSCLSILDYDSKDTRYTVKENFIEYVRMRYPEKAEMLEKLIATFPLPEGQEPTKTSNWDHEGFFNLLRNEIAGRGSNGNCEEFYGYYIFGGKQEEPVNPPEEQVVVTPPPAVTVTTQTDECLLEATPTNVDTTVPHKVVFGDSWEEIVKAYFPTWNECFDKMYEKGGAIQALKKALATKRDGTLDKEMYKKLLDGYIPSVINIPEKLGDCIRNNDGKVKPVTPEGTPVGYMGEVGQKTGYDEITLTDCNGLTASGSNEEEALQNFNDKYDTDYTLDDILENRLKAE